MNRRIVLATLLSVALPVFAQDAAPAAAPAQPASQPAAARTQDDDAAVDRFCLRETGSLIRRRAAKADGRTCASGQPGRVYTQDDLRSTGEVDIANALRRLDPAIR